MFRIVHAVDARPFSFPVDPTAEFEPGQAAQLWTMGNQVVCGVSDGSAPIGIIDDVKKNAFSAVSIDEIVIATPPAVDRGDGVLVSSIDYSVPLENSNVIASSFVSRPVSVELIAKNGLVTFLAGTPLNFSSTDSGTPDSIRTVVSYTYHIPNVPGDNSTFASGRVTVWLSRMIFQTDQFETNQRYPLNAPVFINESGLFTTRQISENYPSIGIVTGPPTSIWGNLEIYWM